MEGSGTIRYHKCVGGKADEAGGLFDYGDIEHLYQDALAVLTVIWVLGGDWDGSKALDCLNCVADCCSSNVLQEVLVIV
jgi:hypothetical protein